jgi:hypothetical protein
MNISTRDLLFKTEVMGKNRMNNRFFSAKAMTENVFGKGLSQALNKALAA